MSAIFYAEYSIGFSIMLTLTLLTKNEKSSKKFWKRMAKKGTKKARSVEHEDFIAELFGGRRSPSSGAAATDKGDVQTKRELFDCKMTGGPEYDLARQDKGLEPIRSGLLRDFDKVADEAWAISKEPAIALRYWAPEMAVADNDGWVNLVVRLAEDDGWRSERLSIQENDCPEDGTRFH